MNWSLVVIDDASDPPAHIPDDPRIRLVRNAYNVGGEHGDMAHLRTFLDRYCAGDAFVYLCDDDWWIPNDLLSQQVLEMERNPALSFVLGGMAQWFPDDRRVFSGNLFPSHTMTGSEYCDQLAGDPANRNIVSGATLFRTDMFRRAGALNRAQHVRWQAGYALTVGAAMQGDVLYLNKPCVMTGVDAGSASYRGTQMGHLIDALNSIDAGFGPNLGSETKKIRDKMARSVLLIYVCNKIGHALGWGFAVAGIESHFLPAITAQEFLDVANKYAIPLPRKVKFLIESSDDEEMRGDWSWLMAMCKGQQ